MQKTVHHTIYIRPSKFFRIRLLALSNPEIEGLLKGYDKTVAGIRANMAKIAWYMRGGVAMQELLDLPQSDYKFFTDVIEDNFELSRI